MNRITKLTMLGFLATAMVLMPVSANAQTCVTAPSGLVSCWPADGNAKDIVGENDGTLQNGITFTPGLAGLALSLDGVDDYVDVPDSASLDGITDAITVSAWIRPEAFAPPLINMWVFARRDPLVRDSFGVTIATNIGVEVRTTTFPINGSILLSRAFTIQFGKWQHIAATADTATGQVRAYINGDPVSLTAVLGPSTISGKLVNADQLFFGRRQSSSTAEGPRGGAHYKGLIDEVEVFDRALDAREVRTLFLSFLSQAIENLVQDVISLDLVPGLQNNLVGELDAAAQALHDPNQGNNVQAAKSLQNFIDAVAVQRGGAHLSEADADALIAAAQAIIDPLGG